MKIYNEIVIDMNPESSSFEEVLHEDSFEYSGDLALAEGRTRSGGGQDPYKAGDKITYGSGTDVYYNQHTGDELDEAGFKRKQQDHLRTFNPHGATNVSEPSFYTKKKKYSIAQYTGDTWEDVTSDNASAYMANEYGDSNYWSPDDLTAVSSMMTDKGLTIGGNVAGMEGQTEGGGIKDWILEGKEYRKDYDFNDDGSLDVIDIMAGLNQEKQNPGTGLTEESIEEESTPFTFTYDETGEFDPTSQEFKQYVETTGSHDALLEGFDLKAEDKKFFEPVSTEPLGFLQEEKALGEEKLGIDMQTISENLRQATESYGMARRKTGMQAGQSLFDIRSQVEGAQGKTGFAGSGAIASTAGRAQRGVFQDYQMQQQELASGMKGAQTAFDIGQQDIALGRKGVDIDYRQGVSDFWKTEEEKFYDRLMEVESYG